MFKTGIITQARMTSSRLPGKILLSVAGATILEHHIHRLAWAKIPVYIATTINESDQCIVDYANKLGVPFYRGDEHNVLQRFYNCAEKFGLDIIIRVTSDCPLIDGNIVADGLSSYLQLEDRNAYLSNALVRTIPRGLDFEIFSFALLKDAYLHAHTQSDQEHVTPYINQNRSGKVSLHHYTSTEDHSGLRWTLDTEDDWKLIQSLFEDYRVAELPYTDVLKIIQQHPELAKINNHIKQKEIKL